MGRRDGLLVLPATYLLFDMVYTMILVPYETLVPEMTDDFKQKTKFSGARISMAQMSAILASFLPGILLSARQR